MNELSARLRAAIKKSGMSHRQLEMKTGIPHSAIQRYASGSTDNIPIERLTILAKALGTTAGYLLGWEGEPPATNKDSGRISEFVKLFSKLTAEQQSLIISQIKGILSNQ